MGSNIQAILRSIHRFEDTVLVSALVSMLVMAVVQICLRNFFDAGLLWAESLLRILVLWIAMLGAMVATRESNHISIDALSRYLGPTIKQVSRVVIALFSAMICGVVAYYAYEFVQFEYEDGTIAFGIVPTWVCQSIIPVGFSVMALRFFIAGFTGIRNSVETGTPE
ncbi:MAG: TRAP transporter small permease [bacterium]|nr:TRAP transporter small permease [Gammaproteobacteria bacterium]HIL97312.1 TRAP transporter small permease [Pseudomonadales bacterium]